MPRLLVFSNVVRQSRGQSQKPCNVALHNLHIAKEKEGPEILKKGNRVQR